MTYDFLHRLIQALLPVVIYDKRLIKQLDTYEYHSFIVTSKNGISSRSKFNHEGGVRMLKITMAGRRAVRRHLIASKHGQQCGIKTFKFFLYHLIGVAAMNMSQFSASLDHIDNVELARLASLWSAQALSGQVEVRSIAYSYAAEQRRR